MTHKHRILVVALLSAGGMAAASPSAEHKAPPPDSSAPKALLDLRGKMLAMPRAEATKDPAQFRALCDADGYPLVGNVANKGNRYQPSQLCADLRSAKK